MFPCLHSVYFFFWFITKWISKTLDHLMGATNRGKHRSQVFTNKSVCHLCSAPLVVFINKRCIDIPPIAVEPTIIIFYRANSQNKWLSRTVGSILKLSTRTIRLFLLSDPRTLLSTFVISSSNRFRTCLLSPRRRLLLHETH